MPLSVEKAGKEMVRSSLMEALSRQRAENSVPVSAEDAWLIMAMLPLTEEISKPKEEGLQQELAAEKDLSAEEMETVATLP